MSNDFDLEQLKCILLENDSKLINFESDYIDRQKEIDRRDSELNRRTKTITEMFQSLSYQQRERNEFRRKMQFSLSIFFMIIVGALTLAIIVCVAFVLCNIHKANDYNIITVLVGSCVTYLASVISIVAIIVKYMFPSNDDKLIDKMSEQMIEEEKALLGINDKK